MKLKSLMLLALLVVLGLSLSGNTKAQDDSGHKVFLPIVAVCCNEEEAEHLGEPIPDYTGEDFVSAASTNPSAIPIVQRFQEPMVDESPNAGGYTYLSDWDPKSTYTAGWILHPSIDYNDNRLVNGKKADESDTYPVKAIGDGIVSKTGVTVGGYVFIESKLRGGEIIGFQALHLNSDFDVAQWDSVRTGDQIGTIDKDLDFGAHLDWQIQISDTVAFAPGNWPSGGENIDWYLARYVHPKKFIDEYNSSQVRLYEGIYLGYEAYTGAITGIKDQKDDPRRRTEAYGDGVHNLPDGFSAKSLNVPIGKTVIMYERQNADKNGRSRAFSYPVMNFDRIGYRNWGGSLGFTPSSLEVVDNCRKTNALLAIISFGSRDCSSYTEPTLSFVDLVSWFTLGIQVHQSNVVEIWSERPTTGTNLVSAAATTYYACVVQDIPDLTGFYYPDSNVPLKGNIKYAKVSSLSQKPCPTSKYPTRFAGTNSGDGDPPKDTSEDIEVWDYGCGGASIRIYNADGKKCAPLVYGWNHSLPFSPARVEVNVGNIEIDFCPEKSETCHEVSGTASLVGSSIYGKISRAEVKPSGQIDNIDDYVEWCKTRTGKAVEKRRIGVTTKYYTDRNYTIKNHPDSLTGMYFLAMPNDDRHNSDPEYVTCKLRKHVKVVLAVDPRGSLPDWVRNDFSSEGQEIGVTDDSMQHFNLYGCKAESGTLVLGGPDSNGGNSDANYIIIFKRLDSPEGSDRCNAKFNVKPDNPIVYPIANSSALTETPLIVWEQTDKNTGDKLFAQVQVFQNGNTVYDSGFLPEGVEQHVPVIEGFGYFTARVVVKDLKGEWIASSTIGFTILQPDCNHANFGEVAVTTSDSCRGEVVKLGNAGKVDLVSKGLYGKSISVWVPQDSWALLLEKADGSAGENCVGWYNGEPGHKWATTVDHWWRRGTELNYTINGKIEAMVIGNSSENMYCQGLHPYETEPFASYTLGENPTCTNPAILAGYPEQARHWTYEGNGTTCGWNYNGWISNNGRFISFNVTNPRVKMYHDGINSCGGTFDLHAVSMWWLLPHETECSNATPTPGATPTPSPTNTPFATPIATSTPTPTEIPPSLQTLQAETDYSVVVPNSPDPQGISATFGNYGAKRVIKLTSEHHGWLRIRIASDWVDNIYMSDGSNGLWTVLGEFSSYAPDARVHEYEPRFGVKPFSQVVNWNYEAMVGANNTDMVMQTVSPKLVIWPGAVVYVVLKNSAPANETPHIAWQRHRFCNEYPDTQETFISDEGACYGNRLTLPGTGTFNLVENGWYGKAISLRVPLDKWALALENVDGTGGEVCTGNFAGEAGSRWNTKEDYWWENGQQTTRKIDGKIALIITGGLANQYCNGLHPATVTATPTPTATPTRTPAPANTVVPTSTPVPTGTQNPTPLSTPTVVPTATSTVVATNTPVVVPSPTTEAPFGTYNLGLNPSCKNPAILVGLLNQASSWTKVGDSGCGWAYNGWLGNNGRFVRLSITTQRVKVDSEGNPFQCGGDLDTKAVTLWWLGEWETICPGAVVPTPTVRPPDHNSVQVFLPLVVR